MNLKLLPITSAADSFLLHVYASSRAEELKSVAWTDDIKNAFVESQFEIQSRYYVKTYPHGTFDVIEFNGEFAGRFYTVELEDEIRILDATLLPEFRNQGIGTKLITDALTAARLKNKPVRIYLETDNLSQRLFSRLGFCLLSEDGIYGLWEKKAEENDQVAGEKTASAEAV